MHYTYTTSISFRKNKTMATYIFLLIVRLVTCTGYTKEEERSWTSERFYSCVGVGVVKIMLWHILMFYFLFGVKV